ncbi:hypothetical protein GK48_10460 [Salmonella enterica subsp. diarizonae]|nr:hypothetical protein [Salmonella enterica subsp. diarizonae]
MNGSPGAALSFINPHRDPLVDWILFRAFSKDAAGGANSGQSMQHYQAFADQMGIKQNTDRFMARMKQAQFDGGTA